MNVWKCMDCKSGHLYALYSSNNGTQEKGGIISSIYYGRKICFLDQILNRGCLTPLFLGIPVFYASYLHSILAWILLTWFLFLKVWSSSASLHTPWLHFQWVGICSDSPSTPWTTIRTTHWCPVKPWWIPVWGLNCMDGPQEAKWKDPILWALPKEGDPQPTKPRPGTCV